MSHFYVTKENGIIILIPFMYLNIKMQAYRFNPPFCLTSGYYTSVIFRCVLGLVCQKWLRDYQNVIIPNFLI